jgi:hypothetical protein
MEFASEMVVKATVRKLKLAEVPTTLSPDGRSRPPHLRSWRDGWRHLRFLLLFSPRWLFLYPGFALFIAGLLTLALLSVEPRTIAGVTFDIHTMLYSSAAMTIGFQAMQFWAFAKIYGMREGIVPWDPGFRSIVSIVTLERGLLASAVLLFAGVAISVYALSSWGLVAFGALQPSDTMRFVIPAVTAILLSFQIVYGTFFLSVLEIRGAPTMPDETGLESSREDLKGTGN